MVKSLPWNMEWKRKGVRDNFLTSTREMKHRLGARYARSWLSDHLYRKTGERVPVERVLALPGWYVTCSVPSPNLHIINPKMCNFMADGKGTQIPEPQRCRIMTAIEECYTRAWYYESSPGSCSKSSRK